MSAMPKTEVWHFNDGTITEGPAAFLVLEQKQVEFMGKKFLMKLGQVDNRRGLINYHEIEEVKADGV